MRTFSLRFFPNPSLPPSSLPPPAVRTAPTVSVLRLSAKRSPPDKMMLLPRFALHACVCLRAAAGVSKTALLTGAGPGATRGRQGGAGGTELAVAGKVNAAARLGVGWVAEVRSGPAVYQRDGAIGVARDERGATVWGCAAFVLRAAMLAAVACCCTHTGQRLL